MNERETIEAFLQDPDRPKKFTSEVIRKWSGGLASSLNSTVLKRELEQMLGEGRLEGVGHVGRNQVYSVVSAPINDISLSDSEGLMYSKWEAQKYCGTLCVDASGKKLNLPAYAWQTLKEKHSLHGLFICKKPEEIEQWVAQFKSFGIDAGSYGGGKDDWLGRRLFCVASVQKTINKIKTGGLRHIKGRMKLLLIMNECDGFVVEGKSAHLFCDPCYMLMHFPDTYEKKQDVYDLPSWLRVSNVKK